MGNDKGGLNWRKQKQKRVTGHQGVERSGLRTLEEGVVALRPSTAEE